MNLLYLLSLFIIGIIPKCLSADTFYIQTGGSGTGADCTDSTKACATINLVLKLPINGKRTIILCGGYTISESLTLNGTTFVVKSNDTEHDVVTLSNSGIGGKYYFSINDTTTFTNLTFDCKSSTFLSDSVFYNNENRVEFEDVVFNTSDGSLKETSGIIYSQGGELTITKCTFKLLDSTGNYSIIFCIDASITLYDCSFINCSHFGNTSITGDETHGTYGLGDVGGCIYHTTTRTGVKIKIGSPDKVTLFENCSSTWGGAMYFSFEKNPDTLLVTNVTLNNNLARNYTTPSGAILTDLGNNLFIDKVNSYLVTIENFPFFAGRSEGDKLSMGNKDGNIIKLITYANKYKDNLYVGNNGNHNTNCNSTKDLCQLLSYVGDYLNYARYIYIVDNYTMTQSWSVNSAELTLQGYDENAAIFASGECGFDIEALKITTLKIIFNEGFCSAGTDCFLKVETDGKLEVTSTSFSLSKPELRIPNVIISLVQASLTIDSCTFIGIDSTGTVGSVLSGEGKVVFIYGCTFEDCSCENGEGGALNVNFDESLIYGRSGYTTSFKKNKATRGGAIFLHPEESHSYIFTDLTFGTGEEENDATNGKNIFIISSNLNTTCNSAHFPTFENEVAGDNFFEGVEEDGDDARDLIDIMKGRYKEGPQMIWYSDNNGDILCNATDQQGVEKECEIDPKNASNTKIAYEASKVKFATVNVTIFGRWKPQVNYVWEGNGYMIYGFTHDTKIVILNNITFTISTDAQFRNLTLTIPPAVPHTIFTTNFGELVLYFVTIVPEDGVRSNINGSLFLMERFADSQFESVSLVNITTDATGNVIKATVGNGKQMRMTGVDYTNCITNGSCGGALHVDVEDGGYFYFIKSGSSISTVTGCKSQSKGGAIYMLLHTNPLSVTFTDVEFGTVEGQLNEAPDGGANLYVLADDLEESLMTASFTISSDYGLMRRIVFEDVESELSYALTDVFPDYSSNMYISGEINKSEVFCGSINSPCVSLNRAFKKSSGSRKELCIVANISHNEQLNCNKDATIIGLDNTSGIICGKDSKFAITTDLNISSLIFTLKETKETLMKVTGCTYTATSLTFTPEEGVESVSLNSPLVTISDKGRGVITTCVFNGVSGNNINGGAINAMLSTSTSIYLKGCSFTNCKIIGGNGGALYVNVSDDASIIIQSDGTNPCVFKKCSATKAESKDSKVLLLSNEGEEKEDTTTEQPVVETGRGGAFYLRFGKHPNYILVEDVIFGEGDEANSGDGRDFFVESVTIEEVVTADRFPILSSLPKDYDGGKAISSGETEAKSAKSLVKSDSNNNMMMIIIISAVAVVVLIVVVVVIIICLKMKK